MNLTILKNENNWKKSDVFFFLAIIACLTSFISSPIALILGFTVVSLKLLPKRIDLAMLTKKLLACSIVGLGFGVDFDQAIHASHENIMLIVTSIFGLLATGWLLTTLFKIDKKLGYLISAGTAICGGSAIAAISSAINAKENQTSMALAIIFILNSIALFLFPPIGNLLGMSQHAFGVWCAIAIHDTSSVVGAAAQYGTEALTTATTLKLARALWIIPIAFISSIIFKSKGSKVKIPSFIILYCAAIVATHFTPNFSDFYDVIFHISKHLLIVCLFLVGAGINIQEIKLAGAKTLMLGVSLWFLISSLSLIYILYFY